MKIYVKADSSEVVTTEDHSYRVTLSPEQQIRKLGFHTYYDERLSSYDERRLEEFGYDLEQQMRINGVENAEFIKALFAECGFRMTIIIRVIGDEAQQAKADEIASAMFSMRNIERQVIS